MKRNARRSFIAVIFILPFAFCLLTSVALANPTQEEVLRSIEQNVRDPASVNSIVPFLIGAAVVLLLILLYSYGRRLKSEPKIVNNQGKLLKEVGREAGLKPAELKQLAAISTAREYSSPLLLLLCPSLLEKAAEDAGVEIDRQLLNRIIGQE